MPLIRTQRRAHGVVLFSLGLSVALMGCSQNIEESKAFQKEVSRIARIDDDLRATNAQLAEIKSELGELSASVGTLRTAGPGGNEEALKALEQRLIRLETLPAGRGAKTVALKTEAATAETAPAAEPVADDAAPVAEDSPKAVETAKPADEDAAPAKVTVKKTRGESNRKSSSGESTRAAASSDKPRTKAAGFYHKVKQGDNLNTIATQYSVPLDSLQSANKVLANRSLVAGQMIYVPAKR